MTHGTGPLLVVAGAGTGKTRVLTRRVGWLVAGGLPARAVLAITFTNKAADVMKERLAGLAAARDVWAGTFHAFAARLLRRHGPSIGIARDFTILDRDDQRRLLKDLVSDLDLGPPLDRPADLARMIGHLKNGGGGKPPLDLFLPADEEAFDRLLDGYARRLETSNLLDFDDLLGQALRLLVEVDEVREQLQERIAHVLVDEYQDTNRVQAALLKAMLGPSRNLTVVGDPDQSIYRWRGATVRNIVEFETEYPGARKILLERNYRSTRHILEAAEDIVAANVLRHAKRLYTENPAGEKLQEVQCLDPEDEGETAVSLLEGWRAQGMSYGEMAVFYRVNWLSRALEIALRIRDVPYVVVAGVEFFQRREIKDILAYARLVENPADDAAFLRIANVPRRGVGEKSLGKIRRAALAHGLPCLEAVRRDLAVVSGRAKRGLAALLGLLEALRCEREGSVASLLEGIVERSDYDSWLAREDAPLEASRAENVAELLAFGRTFDRTDAAGGLGAFLERTALVSDQDGLDTARSRVSLMTVHAAKGLEFDGVVIVGAEEDLFPHAWSANDAEELEEERRLFYVAMTRARERLAFTHAAWRPGPNRMARRRPSPYLHDLPPEGVVRRDRTAAVSSSWVSRRDLVNRFPGDGLGHVREVTPNLRPGDRVRHPYFGEGRLAECQGAGADARVAVDFDVHGRKQLLLSHARLERL